MVGEETLSVNNLANFVALPVRGSWASQARGGDESLPASLARFASCYLFSFISRKINGRLTHRRLLVALYGFQRRLGQFDVQHGDSVCALSATI